MIRLLEDSIPKDAIFSDMASNSPKMDIISDDKDLKEWTLFYFDYVFSQIQNELETFKFIEKTDGLMDQTEKVKKILLEERNVEL